MNRAVSAVSPKTPARSAAVHPAFRYVAYLALIDLFLCPYFTVLVVPYSLPIVMLALVALGRVRSTSFRFHGLVIAFLFMTASVMTAMVLGKSPDLLFEDFKRLLQFISTFVYFFYFYTVAEHLSARVIKRIMMLAIAYIVSVAVAFVVTPYSLIALRQYLYSATAYRIDDLLTHSRFTYLFSDPNTAGYFLLVILFFVVTYFKNRFTQSLVMLVSGIFVTVLTQSVGVAISMVGATILVLAQGFARLRAMRAIRSLVVAIGLCSLLLLAPLFFPEFISGVSDSLTMFEQRVASTPTESRLLIYRYAVTNFSPFFWGQGYMLLRSDGAVFRPHSDHVRLVYSYGIIPYVIIVLWFFSKIHKRGYQFLIPAFVAFSVNSLIDEQKLLAVFLVLLALMEARNRRESDAIVPVRETLAQGW